ncbi:unnamed protein product [Candida verbasci]|uniref:Uncharacterized protein n=1 Tax=Candida verbasci TaxID=1227364 RepID=A0A9W4TYZ7_9ASCO|nr:unnamed protein product [Candida verbasci]
MHTTTNSSNNNNNNNNNNNTMYSTATTSSKYNHLPKFNNPQPNNNHRYISNDIDHHHTSINSLPFNRTISSSSSIISTPSNNIRRFQKQQHERQLEKEKDKEKDKHNKEPSSSLTSKGRSIKTRLLNLQQSQKHQVNNNKSQQQASNSKNNTLHHIHNTNEIPLLSTNANSKTKIRNNNSNKFINPISSIYDYSVFTHHPNSSIKSNEVNLPFLKESQIKAWESAESTSAIIFQDSSDDDEDDYNCNPNPIKSIPGYTNSELEFLFSQKNHNLLSKEQEAKLLQDYKIKVNSLNESGHIFNGHNHTQSMLNQRQRQILQKKEVLSKIFGNYNPLDLEMGSNGIDDVSRLLSEDDEEMKNLLNLDADFKIKQEDMKRNLFKKHNSLQDNDLDEVNNNNHNVDDKLFDDFDYEKFNKLTHKKMNNILSRFINQYEEDTNNDSMYNNEDGYNSEKSLNSDDVSNMEFDEELLQFTLTYLKQKVKEETNNLDEYE